jgi:hypothetical protein
MRGGDSLVVYTRASRPMRHITSLLVCAFVLMIAATGATRAESPDAERLVGLWFQDIGSENLVRFGADRTVSLYLRKGELADLRSLDGKWVLDDDNAITMTFSVMGKSFSQKGKISFEGDAMVLTDPKGERTHHRRHTGPLPEWTKW